MAPIIIMVEVVGTLARQVDRVRFGAASRALAGNQRVFFLAGRRLISKSDPPTPPAAMT